VPQASAVNEPAETGELLRHHKPENDPFADAGSSKGMHIELRAEGISQSNYSQLGWFDCQEYAFRKCPSSVSGTLAVYSQQLASGVPSSHPPKIPHIDLC
jgi:hypothetical protein